MTAVSSSYVSLGFCYSLQSELLWKTGLEAHTSKLYTREFIACQKHS